MSQSWDNYIKQKKNKSQPYNDKKIKSNYKPWKIRKKRHEKETDALLSGKQSKKKPIAKKQSQKKPIAKNKNKKKLKETVRTNTYYQDAPSTGDLGPTYVNYDKYYDFPLDLSKPTRYSKKVPSKRINPYKDTRNPVYKHIQMILTKNKRILLINGYVKSHIYGNQNSKKPFRFGDTITLIEMYYDSNIFIYSLRKPGLNNMQHRESAMWGASGYYIPVEFCPSLSEWTFLFQLMVYPYSKFQYEAHIRKYRTGGLMFPNTNENEDFVDMELNIIQNSNHLMPQFIKIYYELYCDEIDKISFWKGTQKYRHINFARGEYGYNDNLLIPRGYIKREELINNDEIHFKLAIRFLCVEWYGCDDYFANINMTQNMKFNWVISNNYSILDNFKNKTESILFSKNFDNDNWCLYCKNIKNPTNKKKKKKFYIGLMLITLPWFYNYVKIKLIIKCNEKNKKEVIKNVWPGFNSALKIPFKYDILQNSSSLNFTAKFKILKVFNIYDKEINTKDFPHWN